MGTLELCPGAFAGDFFSGREQGMKSRARLTDNFQPAQDDCAAAEPSIDEKTASLVSKGRWSVPGYKVRLLSFPGGSPQTPGLASLEVVYPQTPFEERSGDAGGCP